MKRLMIAVLALMVAAPVFAGTPCEEVVKDIEAKLEAKGIKNYSLRLVPSDKVEEEKGEGKVIGSCEGGTKKIVYTREK
ncbi:MAG: DUF1161 domain-containing protein [Nitrospirota bacterium]|nr:DUF1161 domain-containing protein [Nitrospirota bacterium]